MALLRGTAPYYCPWYEGRRPTIAPVTKDGALIIAPVSKDGVLTIAPVSMDDVLTIAPVTRDGALTIAHVTRDGALTIKGKGKAVYGQEPPSGESTTTECLFNYQLLAAITEVTQWGAPSCSQPQTATDNGVRDGKSN